LDLYSFCSGDPLNRFDATGRFGKNALQGAAYGIGDVMEGGAYYRSFLNPHSGVQEAGYYGGLVAAESVKQAAIVFATEGAFSVIARGLALGARALTSEIALGEEALVGEVAAARVLRADLGSETKVAVNSATPSGREFEILSLGGRRGALESGSRTWVLKPGQDYSREQVYEIASELSVAKELNPLEMRAERLKTSDFLQILPGRTGFSSKVPLFVSKPNQNGGRIWFSTYEIEPFDFDPLMRAGLRKGRTTLISGIDGAQRGTWKPARRFFIGDRWYIGTQGLDVELLDFARLSNQKLQQVLSREGTIICGWCWSSRTVRLLDVLREML
jgi:hypothetical protein